MRHDGTFLLDEHNICAMKNGGASPEGAISDFDSLVDAIEMGDGYMEALPGRIFCRHDAKPRFHAGWVSQCTVRRVVPFPPFAD